MGWSRPPGSATARRQRCRPDGGGLPGADQVRRRSVALCHSREEALEVKARLAEWLAPRGLAFNEDKTRVVTLDEGFDFLGFNVRRYRGKLLIKPSKAAVRRIRERLRTEMRSLRGANASAVIRRLNPIIRGWAAYYRGVVSSETFTALDGLHVEAHLQVGCLHPPEQAEALGRSPGTSASSTRPGETGGCSVTATAARTCTSSPGRRSSDTRWSRAAASPDDPALAEYWAARRRKAPPPPIGKANLRLFEAQDGRCPLCGDWLLPVENPPQTPREWEHWLAATRKTIIRSRCGSTARRT